MATASLARMNMILHNNETAEINTGNTLSDSSFRDENDGLKTFDFAVANPPYPARKKRRLRLFAASAQKPETKRQRCDYSSARCAVSRQCRSAYSHGILNLDLIKGIIGLPANLFYGTGIPACIIVIDKEHAQTAQFAEEGTNQVISGGSVFMIDASRGFIKDGNKNRLREQDIHKIIDTSTNLVTAVWCI